MNARINSLPVPAKAGIHAMNWWGRLGARAAIAKREGVG
jgi:hypothetical protein